MQLKTLTASIMLVFSSSVLAEAPAKPNDISGFYGAIGTVNFDAKSSFENHIGDSATYFKLGWEQHKEEWIWGAGISSYFYSDKASFTNNTTDGTKSSEASAINGYLEGGYKYTVNKNVSLSIMAGYEQVFSSNRGIGMCKGCDSEDIDISAGLYIQPRATYLWDNDWYATASYSSYLGGDVESALFLTVGVLF